MALPPFDTMAFYKSARDAGLTFRQSSILTYALVDAINESLNRPKQDPWEPPARGPEDLVNPEVMMKQVEAVILQKCIDAVKTKLVRATTPEQDGINLGLGIALGALEALKKDN